MAKPAFPRERLLPHLHNRPVKPIAETELTTNSGPADRPIVLSGDAQRLEAQLGIIVKALS